MTDPTSAAGAASAAASLPWGAIAISAATSFVSLLATTAALGALVVKLVKENAKLRQKRKVLVGDRRIARVELERRAYGVPSVVPPSAVDDFDDNSAVVDACEAEDDSFYAPQRKLYIDHRPLRRSPPLEGVGGKRNLGPGAGQEDYRAHDRDRVARGPDTPTAIDPAHPFPPNPAPRPPRPRGGGE